MLSLYFYVTKPIVWRRTMIHYNKAAAIQVTIATMCFNYRTYMQDANILFPAHGENIYIVPIDISLTFIT